MKGRSLLRKLNLPSI